MKKLLFVVLAFGLFGAAPSFAACSKPIFTTAEKRTIDPRRINDELMNSAILKVVNYNRCRARRAELGTDNAMLKMARIHSESMAKRNFFSHTSPVSGQRKMKNRARKAGVKYRALAENIASQPRFMVVGRVILDRGNCNLVYQDNRKSVPAHSYATLAQTTVASWMAPKGHKRNILSKKFGRTGATARLNPKNKFCGNYVLTQVFAN